MKIIVHIGPAGQWEGHHRFEAEIGQVQDITLISPFLVSKGQAFPVSVKVETEKTKGDARSLTSILRDVAQHSLDYATHGPNCACMDEFVREVRAQVEDVMPKNTSANVEERLRVRWRIGHILNSVTRQN